MGFRSVLKHRLFEYAVIAFGAGSFLLPVFFWGGDTMGARVLAAILVCIYTISSFQNTRAWSRVDTIITLLAGWLLIQGLFFSHVPYTSLKESLPFFLGVIFFLVGIDRKWRLWFVGALLAVASVLVGIGLYFLMGTEQYEYLRFISTFYQHNVFAGYMIVPLMLACWFVVIEKPIGRFLAPLLVVIIAGALFLTFSRGGFMAAGVALAIFIAGLVYHSVSFKKISVLLVLIAVGCSAAFLVLSLKRAKGVNDGFVVPSSPYTHERAGETGYDARLAYARSSLRLIAERPLLGFGFDSFGSELSRVLKTPLFFANDPHNLFLRFFIDLGIAGGVLFISFCSLVVVSAWRQRDDLLVVALGSGFMGLLIHNAVDLDFLFPAHILLFFAVSALIVGGEYSKGRVHLRSSYVISGFALVLTLVSGTLWVSDIYAAQANIMLVRGDRGGFHNAMQQALRYDPWNPFLYIRMADEYMQHEEFTKAEPLLDTVRGIHPYNRAQILMRAHIYETQKRTLEAEEAYRTALALAPYRDLVPDKGLVVLYLGADRREDARLVIEKALERFPEDAFNSPQWINPYKEALHQDRAQLEGILRSL